MVRSLNRNHYESNRRQHVSNKYNFVSRLTLIRYFCWKKGPEVFRCSQGVYKETSGMKWVKGPSCHFFEVLQHCQGARKKLHLTFFVLLRLGTNMLMCMCKICLTHLKANFHSLNVQRSLAYLPSERSLAIASL